MVFYFTATGNSLYVAKKLDSNPISIPQLLRHSRLDFTDESIGIVFPIYAGRAPKIVIDFLKKSKFNTNYLYFIGTYGNHDSAIYGIAVRKNNKCEYCLACAHHCPQKTITMKRGEKNADARYRNEHVTLQEIINSNNQNE